MRVLVFCLLFGCAVANTAAAQNLFEVQVFPDETLGRGETAVFLETRSSSSRAMTRSGRRSR